MIDIHDDRVETALDAWAKSTARHHMRSRISGGWEVVSEDTAWPDPASPYRDVNQFRARPLKSEVEAEDVRRRLILADIIEALGIKATICGACGEPWTEGKTCGQKDNGHPFATCYPASEP